MDNGLSNIDDIVAMLDDMMSKGHGHVNVSVDPDAVGKKVDTLGCTDCAKGDLACAIPTLHEGIDEYMNQD
ncbi:MAG: hypothetical protein E7257_03390 [Lachnospiraceae bacterium]|jgi:hypothetical protein|nr:hypothetical protein [Lachnospiraceae bacterium]MBQ9935601.1 hypothetical protein [Lachnospiraceae bacterium]